MKLKRLHKTKSRERREKSNLSNERTRESVAACKSGLQLTQYYTGADSNQRAVQAGLAFTIRLAAECPTSLKECARPIWRLLPDFVSKHSAFTLTETYVELLDHRRSMMFSRPHRYVIVLISPSPTLDKRLLSLDTFNN